MLTCLAPPSPTVVLWGKVLVQILLCGLPRGAEWESVDLALQLK